MEQLSMDKEEFNVSSSVFQEPFQTCQNREYLTAAQKDGQILFLVSRTFQPDAVLSKER
jgi:hypothetical protein